MVGAPLMSTSPSGKTDSWVGSTRFSAKWPRQVFELSQWLTPEESAQVMADSAIARPVADEIADTLIYLVRLADALSVDVDEAVRRKMLRMRSGVAPIKSVVQP
jgi:hypothetical protein